MPLALVMVFDLARRVFPHLPNQHNAVISWHHELVIWTGVALLVASLWRFWIDRSWLAYGVIVLLNGVSIVMASNLVFLSDPELVLFALRSVVELISEG